MCTPCAKNLENTFRKDLTSPGKLRGSRRVRESFRNTLTAKTDVFGFLELVLHQGDFRVEFEKKFCFQSQRW